MHELLSLHQLISGRTELLVEYVLHFLSPSEHEALVQILQRHRGASSAESSRLKRQFNSSHNTYHTTYTSGSPIKCYVTVPSSSDPSSRSESEQPFTCTDSDERTQVTLSIELDEYSSSNSRTAECMDSHSYTFTPPLPAPEAIFLTCQKYCQKAARRQKLIIFFALLFIFRLRKKINNNKKSTKSKIAARDTGNNKSVPIPSFAPNAPITPHGPLLPNKDKNANTAHRIQNSAIKHSSKNVTSSISNTVPPRTKTPITPIRNSIDYLPPQKGAIRSPQPRNHTLKNDTNANTIKGQFSRKMPSVSNGCTSIRKISENGMSTDNGSAPVHDWMPLRVPLQTVATPPSSESEQPFTCTDSDERTQVTLSIELDEYSSSNSRTAECMDSHSYTFTPPLPAPEAIFLTCQKYCQKAARRQKLIIFFALLFIFRLRKKINNNKKSTKSKIAARDTGNNKSVPIPSFAPNAPITPNGPLLPNKDKNANTAHRIKNFANKHSLKNDTSSISNTGSPRTKTPITPIRNSIDYLPPQKGAIRSPQPRNHTLKNDTNANTIKGQFSRKMPSVSNGCTSTRKISENDMNTDNGSAPVHDWMPLRVPLQTVATRPSAPVEPIIPLSRRLPVPDKKNNIIFIPPTGTSTPERSSAVHRRLPDPAYQPRRPVATNIRESKEMGNPPIKMTDLVVIEMWWRNARTQEELLLVRKLPELVSDTHKYHRMYHSLFQESPMSQFLLQVAQAIFEEMVSLDQLIKKILEVAQRLVSADRASLFLVDHRNFELVSTVFDLRYESKNDSDFSKKEIRMPINKGIAGHVAMSGETMNIPDAYSDVRFNKAVDEATGYRTVSILCMPIKVRGKVIAVVQMVNKRDKEAFGNDDEAAFQVFSTFFGLALHHARLYDKIKRKEQKYKVALEVLRYHNTCAEEEVNNLLEERNKGEKINYNDFALNPFEIDDVRKCKGILTMFDDLFDLTKFDVTVLARFVLTVKKNYRKVPYHNFDHGWAVANAMYVMLKHDTENRFDYDNRLALFVASLCHDLDHRGYTNKFMSEIASPLATIYTTSTLEHHHFNMTVTILQQDGHNIFNHMSSDGYKDMLDSIRQCILATDLATLFPNLKKINELVFETPQFDWTDVNHSALGRSFCMTCADLCAAAKPFEVQLITAKIITAEFYQQGDLERQAGRIPIPMMDRSRPEELPSCQVGFLSQICMPCYEILNKLFPTTEPMLMMTKQNLEIWKARASEIEEKNKNQ